VPTLAPIGPIGPIGPAGRRDRSGTLAPVVRALSSAEEHSAYTRAVTGSIPVAPTRQRARTLLCLSRGNGRSQGSIKLAGDVALKHAADLAVGLAFGAPASDVLAGSWAAADAGNCDHV
jgi:hypothetical protein